MWNFLEDTVVDMKISEDVKTVNMDDTNGEERNRTIEKQKINRIRI